MHMPDPTEDAFGFGSIRTSAKDKIKHIKPAAPPDPPPDLARLDDVAGNAGFISREALEPSNLPFRFIRQNPEPTIALNMRAPATIGAAFQRWCRENRYSYPEGLAEIMRRAGVPTK